MSNLLKDAIVDAKVLREAALKTAETTVIDKYAHEVRETLTKLLEQDEMEDPLGGEVEGGGHWGTSSRKYPPRRDGQPLRERR